MIIQFSKVDLFNLSILTESQATVNQHFPNTIVTSTDDYEFASMTIEAVPNQNRCEDFVLVHLCSNVHHHYHQLYPAMIHDFAHSTFSEKSQKIQLKNLKISWKFMLLLTRSFKIGVLSPLSRLRCSSFSRSALRHFARRF